MLRLVLIVLLSLSSTGCTALALADRGNSTTQTYVLAVSVDLLLVVTSSMRASRGQPSSDPSAPAEAKLVEPDSRTQAILSSSEARGAARRGECAHAVRFADEIRALDRAVYESELGNDKVLQKCRDDARNATVEGERALVCAVTAQGDGRCFFDDATCAAHAAADGLQCVPKPGASCFTVTRISDQARQTSCALMTDDCNALLDAMRSDTAYAVTMKECAVYRSTGR